MLTASELKLLDKRISSNVAYLLKKKTPRKDPLGLDMEVRRMLANKRISKMENPLFGDWRLSVEHSDLHKYPAWLEDPLVGVARAYQGDKPLSLNTLVKVLYELPCLSVPNIMDLLRIEQRMARHYMQALRIALPFIMRSMPVCHFAGLDLQTLQLEQNHPLTLFVPLCIMVPAESPVALGLQRCGQKVTSNTATDEVVVHIPNERYKVLQVLNS